MPMLITKHNGQAKHPGSPAICQVKRAVEMMKE
jgi:hypothetical protein